jgi:hypothetical protein
MTNECLKEIAQSTLVEGLETGKPRAEALVQWAQVLATCLQTEAIKDMELAIKKCRPIMPGEGG